MKETKGERKARLESSRKMTNRVKESAKVYKREKVELDDGIDRSSPENIKAVKELEKSISDYMNKDMKEHFLNLIEKSVHDNVEATIIYPDGDMGEAETIWNTSDFMKVITEALKDYRIVPKPHGEEV